MQLPLLSLTFVLFLFLAMAMARTSRINNLKRAAWAAYDMIIGPWLEEEGLDPNTCIRSVMPSSEQQANWAYIYIEGAHEIPIISGTMTMVGSIMEVQMTSTISYASPLSSREEKWDLSSYCEVFHAQRHRFLENMEGYPFQMICNVIHQPLSISDILQPTQGKGNTGTKGATPNSKGTSKGLSSSPSAPSKGDNGKGFQALSKGKRWYGRQTAARAYMRSPSAGEGNDAEVLQRLQ